MTLLAAQVCTTVCNDHDESCKGWTKAGECETNKAFMHRVCPCAAPRHEHARTLQPHSALPLPPSSPPTPPPSPGAWQGVVRRVPNPGVRWRQGRALEMWCLGAQHDKPADRLLIAWRAWMDGPSSCKQRGRDKRRACRKSTSRLQPEARVPVRILYCVRLLKTLPPRRAVGRGRPPPPGPARRRAPLRRGRPRRASVWLVHVGSTPFIKLY